MDTLAHTPAKGTRLLAEQHEPEEQLAHALKRTAQWLHEHLQLRGVKRAAFVTAFTQVLRKNEARRFSGSSDTESQVSITIDGSRGKGVHPYVTEALALLGHGPAALPPGCVVWIRTQPTVGVYYYSTDEPYMGCLYPRFVPTLVTERAVGGTSGGIILPVNPSRPSSGAFDWMRQLHARITARSRR